MTTANSHEDASWPYWTLLFCWHFGRTTPAAKRLGRHNGIAVLGLAAFVWISHSLAPQPGAKALAVPAVALAIGWMALGYRNYFRELDELSRLIQYEAIAFSYGIVLVLWAAAATAANWAVPGFTINPAWVFIAEPLRGIGLVLAARRYR